MSSKKEYVHLILRKSDNGYNADILDWDNNSLFRGVKHVNLFNRQLGKFKRGTLLYAICTISPRGRRMVKKVWEKKSPLAETTLLEKRLAPGAKEKGWLNKAETELFRKAMKTIAGGSMTGEELIEAATKPKPEEASKPKPEEVEQPKSPVSNGYFLSQEARLVFSTAHQLSRLQPSKAVKMMVVGPSGYGKTTLPKLFAQATGRRFLRMNCATVRDPEEWFGYREAIDGSTVFIRSQFAREIERGDLVVVLDEFNRLEPWLHNTLFPLLDEDGMTVVHDEEFRIGANVVVVGTINTGYQYTGTFELDEALYNRFELLLEVGPLPHREEVVVLVARTGVDGDKAERITKIANVLRDMEVVCSTRTTLLVSRMVASGLSIREAYEMAIVRRIPQESGGKSLRKSVVDALNVQAGVLSDRAIVANDVFAAERKEEEAAIDLSDLYTLELSLYKKEGYSLLPVVVIRYLRKLPVLNDAGQLVSLSVREANQVIERLRSGELVRLTLKGILSEDADEPTLNSLGLTGRFSPKEA